MDISDLISDFLESLEIEKGRSTKTTENYGLYLARFLDLITQDFPEGATIKPADLTPEILRKFRLRLNRFDDNQNHERLSALTQSYHLIALRGFLKYLAKRGIKSLDPSLVDLPRAAKKQVKFLAYFLKSLPILKPASATAPSSNCSSLADFAFLNSVISTVTPSISHAANLWSVVKVKKIAQFSSIKLLPNTLKSI